MKLSHQEIKLLLPVLYRVIQRNYELGNVDKDLITLQRRLEQYHETTLQLERE
jgi:2C-methyl-D-erythritol 2,4-cyclodiphosphate synthase